jgi:hypothetical protein
MNHPKTATEQSMEPARPSSAALPRSSMTSHPLQRPNRPIKWTCFHHGGRPASTTV